MSNIALVAVLAIVAFILCEYLDTSIDAFRRLPSILRLAVLRKTFGRRGKLFGSYLIFDAWAPLVAVLIFVLFCTIAPVFWPEECVSNAVVLVVMEVMLVYGIVLIAYNMSYAFKRHVRWAMWIRTLHTVCGFIKTVHEVGQGTFEIGFCSQDGQSQSFILRMKRGEKPIFPFGAASIFFEVIAGQRIIRFVSEMSVP